jgi:YjbE family integral membrane protein
VLLGSLGGVALRIGFTLAIVQLLHVPLLKTAGALLLLYVAIKLPHGDHERNDVEAKPNLWGAVMSIIVADAVMSLDNVLAIAAAAHGSMRLIVFGLALSAPLVMFGAGVLLKLLDRFPLLIWAGAGVLGWVAGGMAATDPFWTRFHLPLETPLSAAGAVVVLAGAMALRKTG